MASESREQILASFMVNWVVPLAQTYRFALRLLLGMHCSGGFQRVYSDTRSVSMEPFGRIDERSDCSSICFSSRTQYTLYRSESVEERRATIIQQHRKLPSRDLLHVPPSINMLRWWKRPRRLNSIPKDILIRKITTVPTNRGLSKLYPVVPERANQSVVQPVADQVWAADKSIDLERGWKLVRLGRIEVSINSYRFEVSKG